MSEMNHYQALGVHPEAGFETIRAAWKMKMKRHHPDLALQLGEEATLNADRITSRLNEAWMVLKNPESRRQYDLALQVLPARCARCGNEGRQRPAPGGVAIGLCDPCWGSR